MSSISSDTGSRKILGQISEPLSERRRIENRLSGEQFPHRGTAGPNRGSLLQQNSRSSGGHWRRLGEASRLCNTENWGEEKALRARERRNLQRGENGVMEGNGCRGLL